MHLDLHINPNGWRCFVLRSMDRKFLSIKNRVCASHNHHCFHCGVQESQLNVVNRNGLFDQNSPSNLVPACMLCTQCYFLESSYAFIGGTLIYVPELAQEEIHALCHTWRQKKEKNLTIYQWLRKRADVVEKELGSGMSAPEIFSKIASIYHFSLKDAFFKDLRLLPFLMLDSCD